MVEASSWARALPFSVFKERADWTAVSILVGDVKSELAGRIAGKNSPAKKEVHGFPEGNCGPQDARSKAEAGLKLWARSSTLNLP